MWSSLTQLVNRYMKRQTSGRLLEDPADPIFETALEHKITSGQKDYHDGMCWEEAVGRCLTAEAVKRAVNAKRVITSGDGDWEDIISSAPRLARPKTSRRA